MRKRRKIFSLLLAISLALGSFGLMPSSLTPCQKVQAAELEQPSGPTSGTCGENINWTLEVDSNGTLYPGVSDAVSPTCYKLTLSGSGDMEFSLCPWYNYREVITSVSIGEGITSICYGGLGNLCSLESIKLPDSITSIGDFAFAHDLSLKTITCGTNLKRISSRAFYNLLSLTDIQFQEGLEEIGEYAFYNCNKLTSISLPKSLTTLKENAFYSSGLTGITIPKNVSCIEAGILWNTKLTEIQVEAGNTHFCVQGNILYEMREDGTCWRAIAYATENPSRSVTLAPETEVIDKGAFFCATYITSLVLPDALTEIKAYAFCGCSSLKSLQLPNYVKNIHNNAFSSCSSIPDVDIPDSVETLGSTAFGYCNSLTAITIGKGLKKLSGAFLGSSAVKTITVSPENPHLESIENVVYNREHTCLHYYAPTKPDTEYQVAEQVTLLDIYAIAHATALKKLYLPKSLETLGFWSIYSNSSLHAIYFAGNAPKLQDKYSCIEKNAGNLILYKTEASTGWNAYDFWNNFTWAGWNPENTSWESGSLGSLTWTYIGSDGRISFTGSGSIPDFTEENPAPWSSHMGSIQTIEAEAVTDIGNYGFYKATRLLRLETKTKLNRIGDYAFTDCSKMKFLDIKSANTIGVAAFQNNTSITGSLTLEKVSSLGAGAFQGCSAISFVTLGSHLTVLEPQVFADCSSLSSFIVPGKVTAIQDGALKGCTSLRSINIPGQVDTICTQAFLGNTALEKVYFYGQTPSEWALDSFGNCSDALNLCYRTAQTSWASLGGSWNGIPLLGQERFYTERQDHYSFGNSAASFGYPAGYHFPKNRFVETLSSITLGTYYYVTDRGWGGSCYGMAGSTLEFYENPEGFPVANYGSTSGTLYGIAAPGSKDAALTKLIETRQISQLHPSISGCGGSIVQHMGDYRGLIQKIEEFERAGGLRVDSKAEPIVMLIYSCCRGHAVIPVSVDQSEDGSFLVKAYDPNYPSELQTLTINKDFSGISYSFYSLASYVPYSEFTASLSGVRTYSEENKTLYLSIDKEQGMVTDTEGKDINEIEGAYEQKPLSAEEEDSFSGIRSFILPEGNYQLAADVPEGETESTNPDSVSFYMGTEECFAEVTSSDENASLQVLETGTEDGSLVLDLQSESQAEETATFTLVNSQGMERTVETGGSNATISIGENNDITIQAPGQESILLDGQKTMLQGGQVKSSFIAGPEENPLKASILENEVACDTKNKLSGTVNAEIISNAANGKDVTVTVEFLENDKAVASYSQKETLNPGLNENSLSFEKLETDFSKSEGTLALSLKLTVTDEDGNTAAFTNEGISITLTKQSIKDDSDSNNTDADGSGNKKPSSNTGADGSSNNKPGNNKPTTTKPNSSQDKDGLSSSPTTRNREVTSVKTDVKKLTLGLGETYSLKASVLPANATDKKLSYTASNKKIAIGSTGKITAKKTGSSKITVKSSNGKTTTVQVTVKKKPSRIKLNATTKTIKAGWKFQIKATFPKGTASHKLTYSSSKKSVATVSSTGKITAKKKGTAIITVKTYNGKKAKMKIIVTKK